MKPVQQLESFEREMDHSSGTACDIPHPLSWGAEETPPLAAHCSVQQPWPLMVCVLQQGPFLVLLLHHWASCSREWFLLVMIPLSIGGIKWCMLCIVLCMQLKTTLTVTDFVPPWPLLGLWMMAIQWSLCIDSHYHIFCGSINLICTFSGHLLQWQWLHHLEWRGRDFWQKERAELRLLLLMEW